MKKTVMSEFVLKQVFKFFLYNYINLAWLFWFIGLNICKKKKKSLTI